MRVNHNPIEHPSVHFNFKKILTPHVLCYKSTYRILEVLFLTELAGRHGIFWALDIEVKDNHSPVDIRARLANVGFHGSDVLPAVAHLHHNKRCNALTEQDGRPRCPKIMKSKDWIKFNRIAPKEVVALVAEESKWAFCLLHAVSFAKFTKQTAVLKSLHKQAYYKEIEKFEQRHGFRWDDIGIRIGGVSLHQG